MRTLSGGWLGERSLPRATLLPNQPSSRPRKIPCHFSGVFAEGRRQTCVSDESAPLPIFGGDNAFVLLHRAVDATRLARILRQLEGHDGHRRSAARGGGDGRGDWRAGARRGPAGPRRPYPRRSSPPPRCWRHGARRIGSPRDGLPLEKARDGTAAVLAELRSLVPDKPADAAAAVLPAELREF